MKLMVSTDLSLSNTEWIISTFIFSFVQFFKKIICTPQSECLKKKKKSPLQPPPPALAAQIGCTYFKENKTKNFPQGIVLQEKKKSLSVR